MIIYFAVEISLSSLTVPLIIRYLAISFAFNIAAAAVFVLFLYFDIIRIELPGMLISVTIGSGIVAGAYFRRDQGRLAKWGECWRISAVMLSPHIVLTILFLAVSFAAWIMPFDETLLIKTSSFLLEMVLNGCFTILLMLTITTAAFRFGSHMPPGSAEGWRNLRE